MKLTCVIQIYISTFCIQSHRKKNPAHFELYLETAGNVFSIVFHGLFLLYYILMQFVMRTYSLKTLCNFTQKKLNILPSIRINFWKLLLKDLQES